MAQTEITRAQAEALYHRHADDPRLFYDLSPRLRAKQTLMMQCILIEVIDSGSTMGLHWSREPEIVVEVKGGEILVTMPSTSLSVVYEKTEDNQLIANSFSARKDEKRKLSLPKFLALAWTAANEKAKQIGWIE